MKLLPSIVALEPTGAVSLLEAAGAGRSDSRRLQNASTNRVEFRGFLRTSVETTIRRNRRQFNALDQKSRAITKLEKRAN